MFNTICNNPEQRARIAYTHCFIDNQFSDEEIDNIVNYCESIPAAEAKVGGGAEDPSNRIRKSEVRWIYFDQKNKLTTPFFTKFNGIVHSLNNQFFNFNLNGYDRFQYTVYDGKERGHYNYHIDMPMDDHKCVFTTEIRKLSFTFLLNDDFEGGEFQICIGSQDKPQTIPLHKGRIVAFPSFIVHRVAPVTKGIRRSLVCWITGPRFV